MMRTRGVAWTRRAPRCLRSGSCGSSFRKDVSAQTRIWDGASRAVLASLCMTAAAILSGAPSRAAEAPPSADGIGLYEAQCAACHGAHLGGGEFGPALKGEAFVSRWRAAGIGALLNFVTQRMPPSKRGGLTRGQYRSLVELISAANMGLIGHLPEPGRSATESAETLTPNPVSGALPEMQAVFSAEHVGPTPDAAAFRDSTFARVTEQRSSMLQHLGPVTDQLLESPPPGEWLAWRRTYDMQSYSPLTQINRRSVAKLTLAWAWTLPEGADECAPLVHDGVLFIQSGNHVQALSAVDGTLLWDYTRELQQKFQGIPNAVHKNLALYGDDLYISTADRHVVALNAKSGDVVWDHEVIPADVPGMLLSAGPTVVRGRVIQGTSLAPYCPSGCSIVGLDAATGSEVWRFDTVAKPGEPGGATWNGAPLDLRYGAASWVPASYDPATKLVYLGTGGTYLIGPLLRVRQGTSPQNNQALYTDSTLALNPENGKLVWYHQHLPRDVWDLDEVFERTLIRMPLGGGVERSLLITIGKTGILDALDPSTGAFAFAKDLGLQNIVTSIDRASGRRTLNPSKTPRPDQPVMVCPSPEGARNWMTTAYDPRTHVLYIPMEEACADVSWQPNADDPAHNDGIDIGWTLKPRPGSDGSYGRIEALDLVNRRTVWIVRQRALLSSSLIATAGGLVFEGDRDREFRALDDKTGRVLWSVRLGGVPNSSPITYSVGGHQFVAVATGGGGPHDSQSVGFTPEIVDASPGTTLWVFSLRK